MHWIEIYPVDSAFHLLKTSLNNWGQVDESKAKNYS